MLNIADFVVRRLHRSLCFHSYRNRDILDYSLVHSIAATKMEIKIYVYDSKHDALLGRGKNLLIEISETEVQLLNYKAILAMWLVVNYKFLCSGPHEKLLKVPKARFCEHAVSCVDMYEKELY